MDAIAQDTKHADPRYLELDEHPTFKGGGPNNFATWVTSHVKYPKAAKKAGVEGTVKVCFVVDTDGKIRSKSSTASTFQDSSNTL